ncbi:variable surface protein [Plasmodium gonderi]|uniref:Variable surface protein n=1 Tax=Plasmodium gonderi TaxID=77519 RepID=A0A1Y1JR82_PLAGO|nr:variable surface protein [Plasmodium gonderi]GAW84005.1 variable surface protein [Plasmodium gonderi]
MMMPDSETSMYETLDLFFPVCEGIINKTIDDNITQRWKSDCQKINGDLINHINLNVKSKLFPKAMEFLHDMYKNPDNPLKEATLSYLYYWLHKQNTMEREKSYDNTKIFKEFLKISCDSNYDSDLHKPLKNIRNKFYTLELHGNCETTLPEVLSPLEIQKQILPSSPIHNVTDPILISIILTLLIPVFFIYLYKVN